MKPANPENVPLDKIPAGWRLLYEEEYRSNVPTRLWEVEEDHCFSPEIHMTPDQRIADYTYITPDLPDNGQPWHAHKPGDPAPVESGVSVDIVARCGRIYADKNFPNWSEIGEWSAVFYRLHEPATKQTTFEAHGHTWFKHTPGDPMPCDGEAEVVLLQDNCQLGRYADVKAKEWVWKEKGITGWRYQDRINVAAEPNAKSQPEDLSAQAGRTSLPTTAAEPTVKPHNPHISDRILELLIVAGHVTPEKVEQARKLAQP